MKKKILTLAILSVFLCCYVPLPPPRIIQNSFPIDRPFDDVWIVLIEIFVEMNMPIDNMEKDSGLITTGWIDFKGQTNEEYCDCGSLGMSIEVNRQGKFNVFVKKVTQNSCEVKVSCLFQQKHQFADSTIYTKSCVSTGNFERQIFELIENNNKNK